MSEKYRNFEHSRARAIKEHCFECSGFNRAERANCPAKGCALWAYRLGYEVDEEGNKVIKRPSIRPGYKDGEIESETIGTSPILDADFDLDDEDEELFDEDSDAS